MEFTEIDSNFSTKLKFIKRYKITILNQIKIEDENMLRLIMKNNIKKIFSKLKLINQLKVVASASRSLSINVIDLTTINLKSIKKHRKISIFFNWTFIASRFSRIISFNLNSCYYTARIIILITDKTLKQQLKFNDVLFIISSTFKFFIDRYNAILSFNALNIEKLNIAFEKTIIKAFQAADILLNRIYDYSKKINVYLNAICNNVNDAIELNLSKMKNAVLKSIAKFVNLFTKKLNALFKKKLKFRKNIALIKEKAINAYVKTIVEMYKFKKIIFTAS